MIRWAAGYFEGEGCIGIKTVGQYKYVRLALLSTDYDVLLHFREVVGIGTIKGPLTRERRKAFWVWNASRSDEVATLLRAMLPYLGARRSARVLEALPHADAVGSRSKSRDGRFTAGSDSRRSRPFVAGFDPRRGPRKVAA